MLAQEARRNAFEVFLQVKRAADQGAPYSVIRLGDGEGAFLGYPTITNRRDVDEYLLRWIRTSAVAEADVLQLVAALKAAVKNADVIGLPRPRQLLHRIYRAVPEAVEAFNLRGESALLADAALHRLLNHALLYRPLLRNARFLGVISCRRIADDLQALFDIRASRWYGVRGEDVTHFTDLAVDAAGEVETLHYPDGYRELHDKLEVPFPGALFLVGAGAFGKIYCHWIRQRGGVAIDIGSMCDSWAGVGRVGIGLGRHARSLDVYQEIPRISRGEAVRRYNHWAQRLGLDVALASTRSGFFAQLPACW